MIFLFSWGKRASHNRAQIVFYLAENLELRREEFVHRLMTMTGCSEADARTELDLSVQRLFHWGAYADKFGGTVQVSSEACVYPSAFPAHQKGALFWLNSIINFKFLISEALFHSHGQSTNFYTSAVSSQRGCQDWLRNFQMSTF